MSTGPPFDFELVFRSAISDSVRIIKRLFVQGSRRFLGIINVVPLGVNTKALKFILKLIFLIIFLTIGVQRRAFAEGACRKLFADVNYEDQISQLLTPAMADAIHDQLVTSLSKQNFISQQTRFDEYLNLRLQKLTSEQSAKVLEILKEVTLTRIDIEQYKEAKWQNEYVYGDKKIIMTTPSKYAGTMLEFHVLSHEVEHAIQMLVLGEPPYSRWNFKNREYDFRVEMGAMMAEGILLRIVAADELTSLKDQVTSDEELPSAVKYYYLKVLNAALKSKNSQEYLQQQWQAGRYSKEHFTQLRNTEIAAPIFGSAAILGFAGAIIYSGVQYFVH